MQQATGVMLALAAARCASRQVALLPRQRNSRRAATHREPGIRGRHKVQRRPKRAHHLHSSRPTSSGPPLMLACNLPCLGLKSRACRALLSSLAAPFLARCLGRHAAGGSAPLPADPLHPRIGSDPAQHPPPGPARTWTRAADAGTSAGWQHAQCCSPSRACGWDLLLLLPKCEAAACLLVW